LSDKLYILVPLFIFIGAACGWEYDDGVSVALNQSKGRADQSLNYIPVKDTIYYLGDEYILISLKEQRATVVFRKDSSVSFNISSGNGNLSKGVFTPAGLYTVQSKSSKAISKQFDNAELYSWVGFNGNIGFHGLAGNGYYHHLGVRPSSHGCVRIGREDGEKLYKKVKVGSPVLVYSDDPAIEIKFASVKELNPNKDFIFQKKDKATAIMFSNRLQSLYDGDYYTVVHSKIFLDGKAVIRNKGFEIGEAKKIKNYQTNLNYINYENKVNEDALSVRIIPMTSKDSSSKKASNA
jgi:hypothetical protein